jgi:hypothetical protein
MNPAAATLLAPFFKLRQLRTITEQQQGFSWQNEQMTVALRCVTRAP